MFIWNCHRRSLTEWISKRKTLPKSAVRSIKNLDKVSSKADELALVWDRTPVGEFSLPRAIVVRDDVKDFLAWASTYLRHIRPLTAQTRVLDNDTLSFVAATGKEEEWSSKARSVDIGLILTEAVVLTAGKTETAKLSFSQFAKTLSYSYAQSHRRLVGSGLEQHHRLKEMWKDAQTLTRQDISASHLEVVGDVWELTGSSFLGKRTRGREEGPVLRALRELHADGDVEVDTWEALFSTVSGGRLDKDRLVGPREERVNAVIHLINTIIKGNKTLSSTEAFLVGLAVSRISVGTLDHLRLLIPYLSSASEAILWYGVCAGIVPGTRIDGHANGLGWFMRRELGRRHGWLDRPTCDVGLNEIGILLADPEAKNPPLRTRERGLLSVELLPLVNTTLAWDAREQRAESYKQTILFDNDREVFDSEMETLMRHLAEGQRTIEELRRRVEARLLKSHRRK